MGKYDIRKDAKSNGGGVTTIAPMAATMMAPTAVTTIIARTTTTVTTVRVTPTAIVTTTTMTTVRVTTIATARPPNTIPIITVQEPHTSTNAKDLVLPLLGVSSWESSSSSRTTTVAYVIAPL